MTLRQTTGLLWMLLSTSVLATPTELMPGDSQAAFLGGAPLEYLLLLESGDSVRIEARQYGADAAAIVLSPASEQLLRVDNLFNQYGPEWIEFTARENGKTSRLCYWVLQYPRGLPDGRS